ncbi:MAG: TlpA family protein disulfide reductase [Nocardioides sp.]
MTGLVIAGVAVVIAVAFGLQRRRTDGSFRVGRAPESEVGTLSEPQVDSDFAALGTLGERATLVQFSSAFCAPCRATKAILSEVAEHTDGVTHIEIDAESHLELVRAHDIMRTPTTIVLDGSGREVARAAGAPRRDQVLTAISSLNPTRDPNS